MFSFILTLPVLANVMPELLILKPATDCIYLESPVYTLSASDADIGFPRLVSGKLCKSTID